MKARWLGMVLAAGLFTSAAMATNINISVQQTDGTNTITVAPGGTVNYKIIGTLSDAVNEGLALIGLSLDFDLASPGGDLAPAGTPLGAITCGNPMPAFVIPDGITNPAGFGGTIIGGNLIQIGGAQNTIKNTAGNAPFPIGTVLTGVAQPGGCGPATIATGSLTIPLGTADGAYHLNAFDVFANVIKDGETGEVFYATEATGVGAVTNLTIHVAAVASLATANPADEKNLPRTRNNTIRLTFSNNVAAPLAGQLKIRQLFDGGLYGPDLSPSFNMTVEGGTVVRIRDTGATLVHRTWYGVGTDGTSWPGVQPFEVQYLVQMGDCNNDGRVLFTDLACINARIPTDPAADDMRQDINGDGRVLFTDMAAANARIPSDNVPKPTGH